MSYNFHPKVFSSHLWNILYFNAFSMTESNRVKVKNFFTNLFIPCNECQTNYEEYLSLHPISSLYTREEMVQWVFDFHNSVRASKNLGVLSFDYTYLIYNNHNANSELYRTLNVENDECMNC
jgi:hypothetical protein